MVVFKKDCYRMVLLTMLSALALLKHAIIVLKSSLLKTYTR